MTILDITRSCSWALEGFKYTSFLPYIIWHMIFRIAAWWPIPIRFAVTKNIEFQTDNLWIWLSDVIVVGMMLKILAMIRIIDMAKDNLYWWWF